MRVADLQAGMGSVRSRRYYPAYSIRKRYKSPLRTTHDEEMERRRRLPRRETSSWPTEPVFLLLVRAPCTDSRGIFGKTADLNFYFIIPIILHLFMGVKEYYLSVTIFRKILFFLVSTEDLIRSNEV